MTNKSSRILLATAITLALWTGATTVVVAQTPDRVNDRAVTTDRDSGFDFGWLGLIGLAGLAGMKRRDDHPVNTSHAVR